MQNEQESIRMARVNSPPVQPTNPIKTEVDVAKDAVKAVKIEEVKKIIPEPQIKKAAKSADKKSVEKKSATI